MGIHINPKRSFWPRSEKLPEKSGFDLLCEKAEVLTPQDQR
jgi:hypothetical protein